MPPKSQSFASTNWGVLVGTGLTRVARSAALLLTALLLTALITLVVTWTQLGHSSLPYVIAGALLVLLSLVCVSLLANALLQALAERDAALRDLERTATLGEVGVFEHDQVSDQLKVNDVFRELWAFSETEFPILTPADLLSRVPPHNLMQVERWIRDSAKTAATEAEIVLPDGSRRWLQMNLVADAVDGYGTVNRGAVFDVTALRESQLALQEANSRLHTSSMTDELTGLYNRRYVREQIADPDQRKPCEDNTCAVILLDIDHFKRINDQMGHDCGDHVLSELSRLLRENVRGTDTVARWGGEEFLVVLPGSNREIGIKLAEKLRSRIEAHCFRWKEEEVIVTASLGLAMMDWKKTRLAHALMVADSNLYEAKRTGRNKVIAEPPELF